MSEENIAASRRFIDEAFNGGNFDVIDELTSDDFVDHDPLVGDTDREGAKQSLAGYRGAFPDLQMTIEDIFAAGDKVVYRWTAEGTFENEMMGLHPTGEKGDPVRGISIDRFEGGKMVESWSQWDTLTFMRDIGAIDERSATPSS